MLPGMSTNTEQTSYPDDAYEDVDETPWPSFESEEEEEQYWNSIGEPW
jgi:hypothetical protein